eukprot:1193968-Prorocentrum_minimum.AAC.3
MLPPTPWIPRPTSLRLSTSCLAGYMVGTCSGDGRTLTSRSKRDERQGNMYRLQTLDYIYIYIYEIRMDTCKSAEHGCKQATQCAGFWSLLPATPSAY